MAKSADPDQTAHHEQSDLGLHCLLRHPISLKLDPSPTNMLSSYCFCSGKFQSPRIECLSRPPLLSSLPSESSCLLPCILLPLLLHTASSSNLFSHHRGQEHLPTAFGYIQRQNSHSYSTQTRVSIAQVWLEWDLRECEWSSAFVFTNLSQPQLSRVSLERHSVFKC